MLFYKTLNFITFVSLKTIRISWTFSVLLTGSLIERRWIRRTSEENELKPAHDRSVRTRTTATRSFVFAQIFRVYWLRSTREGKRNCARCFCDSNFLKTSIHFIHFIHFIAFIDCIACIEFAKKNERKKRHRNEHRTSNIEHRQKEHALSITLLIS